MAKPFGYVTKTGQFLKPNVLDDYAIKSSNNTSNALVDDNFTGKYGSLNLREPKYNPLKLVMLLELNPYHESCVYRKAHDIAGAGFEIKASDPESSNTESKELDLFFHNPLFNVKSIFEACEVDYQAGGYGLVELVKENKVYTGKPFRMKHIVAHTMRLHNSRQMFVQQIGTKKVYYKAIAPGNDIIDDSLKESDLHKDTGVWYKPGSLQVDKRATEVLYFNRYSPRDWWYGIPEAVSIIPTIKGESSRTKYNITFFDNYAVPSYAVFISGPFKDEDEVVDGQKTGKTVLQAAIEDHFKELARNPHSTLILTLPTDSNGLDPGEIKIEFKPLSVDVKEASFRLYRKDNRDEIISKHGVPPYLISVFETGQLAGNLGQEATKIYAANKVKPGQEKYNNAITDYIIKECFKIEDFYFEFTPLTIDETTQDLDNAGKLFDKAAMSPNDLIRNFGKKYNIKEVDHPAMDAHYLHGQAVDLEVEVTDTNEVQNMLDETVVKLLEVAENEVSSKDGNRGSEIISIVKKLKESTGMGNPG